MISLTRRTTLALIAILLAVLGTSVPALAAATSTPASIFNPRDLGTVNDGPYKINVSVQPASVVVGGAVNLVVRPFTADGQPVTNARISVVGVDPNGDRKWLQPALPMPADPGLFVANADVNTLDIDKPGNWLMEVTVQGAAGEGTAQFPISVAKGLNGSGNHSLEVFYGLLMAAMFAVVGALVWRARRRRSSGGRSSSHQEPATQ